MKPIKDLALELRGDPFFEKENKLGEKVIRHSELNRLRRAGILIHKIHCGGYGYRRYRYFLERNWESKLKGESK